MNKVHSKISFNLEKNFFKNQIFMIFDPFLTWKTVKVKTIFIQGNVAVCYWRQPLSGQKISWDLTISHSLILSFAVHIISFDPQNHERVELWEVVWRCAAQQGFQIFDTILWLPLTLIAVINCTVSKLIRTKTSRIIAINQTGYRQVPISTYNNNCKISNFIFRIL